MIIGPNLAEMLNFSTVKHGGAHGGAATLYRPIKLGDLPRFRENPTFSRPQGGRSRGGGWGGAEMGGRMGGRLSAYMGGGDGGGRPPHLWSYL